MNDSGSGVRPDDGDTGSWTSETLPLSVRKVLLERELKKLGFRKASEGGSAQQQQQPQGGSSHPSAWESSNPGEHGD